MEKFVVKTKRQTSSAGANASSASKHFKQRTLYSLQRVVIVEDILRYKAQLELPGQQTEVMVSALNALTEKQPSITVLKDTKIGKTVKKLTKHNDMQIADKAKLLIETWEKYVKTNVGRPVMDVRCDAKTEKLRSTGRKMVASALNMEIDNGLSENIEREAFYLHDRKASVGYRRTMRKIVFTLKNNENLCNDLKHSALKISAFVRNSKR